MKPFLGIDLTNDKKNEQNNGSEFLVQTPSPALTNALEQSTEKAENTVARAKLPLVFRIAQYICGFGALLIGLGILKSDVDFVEGYHNAPELHWIGAICAVVWLALWAWSKLKAKSVLETEESTQTLSHWEKTAEAVYNELAVPANARNVDVLMFFYKMKNGELKIQEKGIVQCMNPEFKLFTDEENLYLANLEGKYAFPLSSIVKLHTVKKHIRIAGWNKDEEFNKGIYKQYKLTTDNYGMIHCKEYYILEIAHNGENYGIYFPCYELPAFKAFTK